MQYCAEVPNIPIFHNDVLKTLIIMTEDASPVALIAQKGIQNLCDTRAGVGVLCCLVLVTSFRPRVSASEVEPGYRVPALHLLAQ